MAVQQSGDVTRGHGVKWIADNVIGDAGPLPSAQRVLASLSVANFNLDTDQPLLLPSTMNAFQLTGLIIAAPTISLTTAVGGFYPEAEKTGTPIVSAAQTYSALTSSQLLMSATLAAFANTAFFTRAILPDWAIYFSLTTPQGVAAEARIYAIGIDLSL